MSERNARVLSTIVLATLLGATILAVTPAGAVPVSNGQKATTESMFGVGAPFNGWHTQTTTNTLYLHSDPTGDGTVRYTDGPALTAARLDPLEPDPTGTQTMPNQRSIAYSQTPAAAMGNQVAFGTAAGGSARFPLAADLTTVDPYDLFGFSTTVWAGCMVNNVASSSSTLILSNTYIQARVFVQEKNSDGEWVDKSSSPAATANLFHASGAGNVPDYVDLWSGSTTVGDQASLTGATLLPGERLLVDYMPRFTGGVSVNDNDVLCVLYYDGFYADGSGNPRYSRVTFTHDALRVSGFTTNEDGEPQTGFPAGPTTNNRRFVVEALQAHAMGPGIAYQLEQKHANVRLWDAEASEYVYYVENTAGGYPREVDIQDKVKLVSSRTEQVVPEPDIETHLGGGLFRRSFLFSYTADLAEGRIEPQLYSLSDGWELRGTTFNIGGKGIAFEVPAFESGLHNINPREPTEFAFVLRNTGTTDDSISVSVADPGDGWTARVLGGGLFFLRPGGIALGVVELVPPANGVAGNAKTIVVTASSMFPEVDDPNPITYRAVLTNTVTRDVTISSAERVFQVAPGVEKSFPVTLINEGSKRDSFTIIPSFPPSVQGWSVVAVPSSVQVPAGGISQVQVRITPSPAANTGMTFPLGLTAVEVGNSAISDRIDVTVDVFATSGLILGLLDPLTNRTMRTEGDSCVAPLDPFCITADPAFADTDFDTTAVFRLPVQNMGDKPGRFKVEAFWDKAALPGTIDARTCQDGYVGFLLGGATDGVPDGWRFNYGQGSGSIQPLGSGPVPANANPPRGNHGAFGGFSGFYLLNTTDNPLLVPAKATQDIYFEIGWLPGDPCPTNDIDSDVGDGGDFDIQSPHAAMTVIVTDLSDPTLTGRVTVKAVQNDPGAFRGLGDYAGATHDVAVHIASNEITSKSVVPGQPVLFDVIAVNKANEKDGLKIVVAGAPGWTHHILVKDTVPGEVIPCDIPAADGSITCHRMGVYDEVHFQVQAIPGAGVQVGDVDPITVIVQSTDAPGIARTLQLVARAAGEFDFDLLPRGATTRPVLAGQTVSFPFVVNNAGTADDSYRFSLLTGSPVWQPVLSSSAPLFVPAGFQMPALLTVTAPVGSAQGFSDTFRIKVESVESGTIKTFEVTPIVQPASGLTVFGKDGQDVLIAKRNTDTNVTVRAVQVSGTPATHATFTVDTASLPPGWTVDRTTATVPLNEDSSGRPAGEAVFKIKAPANALGSGQGLLRVQAATVGTSPIVAATDIRLNLASTFGIALNVTQLGGEKMVIAPGGPAIFNLTVQNLGLGPDVVRMSSTQAPAGWTVLFNPGTMSLGPLQKRTIEVKVTAPVSAQPADIASLVVFATSANSPTEIASVPLQAQVGFHDLQLTVVSDGIRRVAPQETNVWVLNLTNNGTLPDQVRLSGAVDTKALASFVNGSVEPNTLLTLEPNQTIQIRVGLTNGDDIPSNVTVQSRLIATSVLDARETPASATATLVSQVLPYVGVDANRDRIVEYFVDRDLDASNGFEEFLPTKTPGGRPLASADLERFLRDDARDSFSRDVTLANGTVERVLQYVIDGDNDGKIDHFLDVDGDDLPDIYCDPDAAKCSNIDFRKDVNGDQVPEFFVDTNGDGAVNAVFDLTRGTFTRVLHVDVDGDGVLDYVVDKNGNGRVDQDETVLYTRTGNLLIVQKVDVDGDGRLDQVFDTDGNGAPDYFIPASSTASIGIVMQDMTGDGVQDWTYDGNNDGRRESYYDPVTGKAHVIDAAGHFVDALKQYWYIGALFVLVLALFAALVLVTRR